MVRLVQPLVANGVMLPSVNPVDTIVGEDEIAGNVVIVSITSNFYMGQKTYNRMERKYSQALKLRCDEDSTSKIPIPTGKRRVARGKYSIHRKILCGKWYCWERHCV